jgi:hypothetical protein
LGGGGWWVGGWGVWGLGGWREVGKVQWVGLGWSVVGVGVGWGGVGWDGWGGAGWAGVGWSEVNLWGTVGVIRYDSLEHQQLSIIRKLPDPPFLPYKTLNTITQHHHIMYQHRETEREILFGNCRFR